MKHPQDLLKITIFDRLYIWWLKFNAYFLHPTGKLFWCYSRRDKRRFLTRREENLLFTKVIRSNLREINSDEIRRLNNYHPTAIEIRIPNSAFELNMDESGGDLFVSFITHKGKQLFKDDDNPLTIFRWWAERYVIRELKKLQKRQKNGIGVPTRVSDGLLESTIEKL